ncbi:4-hydroxyproline epimerase [Pseudomonas mosselii]|uniref:4-hydroxyproline epimerase n=1 Tax=Pseudomonas mosselii TaxID=78327 RepID=UPI00244691FC|nr:4-hydroxyproline epimerase [Pseudomonas mosselii]MDH1143518.1 4-hydroxyproline epimerase [Pseudomonas mosselii]
MPVFDTLTCGNPVRVVAGGAPQLPNVPMAEKREIFQREYDWIRQALMFEPRGHDVMSGTILYSSSRDDCDIGVLFIEVSGCLPMCGHGTIGTVTAALEEGLVVPKVEGKLAIEAPAGRVAIEYKRDGQYIEQVRLYNVASYLHAADVEIEVPELGKITIDLSYGGNYYVIIEPQENWKGLDSMSARDIVRLSPLVRRAAEEALAPLHPEDSRIKGVSHVMWTDKPRHPRANARNAVFYGEKAIDRSPCGTGSSARMAQLVAKGRLSVGDTFVHESIIGTLFDCRVESAAKVGSHAAIMPSVAGWARVIGHNNILVDDRDPLAHGFQLM